MYSRVSPSLQPHRDRQDVPEESDADENLPPRVSESSEMSGGSGSDSMTSSMNFAPPPDRKVNPNRFKLSPRKMFRLLLPVMSFHCLNIVLAAIDDVPGWVVSILLIVQCAVCMHIFLFSISTLSAVWAHNFSSVEAANDKLEKELYQLKRAQHRNQKESELDVRKMLESITETRVTMEEEVLNPHQALLQVQKLDDKVASAVELRQSRHLLRTISAGGVVTVKEESISIDLLMAQLKRINPFFCTMSERMQRDYKLKTDPAVLRVILHNLTAYAMKRQDTTSSYKAYSTVDVLVPPRSADGEPPRGVITAIEVRVRYMGNPLSDDEIAQTHQEVVKVFSSRNVTQESAHESEQGSASIGAAQVLKSPGGTKTVAANGLLSESDSKKLWLNMVEGKDLVVAYHFAAALGGQISIEREFRFSTIVFTMNAPLSYEHSRRSPIRDGGSADFVEDSSLELNKAKEFTPQLPTRLLSNATAASFGHFPKGLKIVSLSENVSESVLLHRALDCDDRRSAVLPLSPENVEMLADVVFGLVEVDKKDSSVFTRVRPIDAVLADVVMLPELLGSDTKGRRWLCTTMAVHLRKNGIFKGHVCILTNKTSDKDVATLLNIDDINCAFKKTDKIDDIKGKLMVAFAFSHNEGYRAKKRRNVYQSKHDSF